MGRLAPRRLSEAMGALTDRLAPQTGLGAVQRVWPDAVGSLIAAQATPTAEHGGTLTVTCSSAVWAADLDLMAPELLGKLNAALGEERLTALRCSSATPRSWSSKRG